MKTFGSLDHKDGKWVLTAEAHVIMKLKRFFGKIGQKQHGTIRIVDTIDTSRDLEWFLQRFPMDYANGVAERLKAQADLYRERASLVEQVLSRVVAGNDYDLAKPMRDYQTVAADLVLASGSLLLCDDMGIGKTLVSIALATNARARPALVVVPKAIQRQWRRRFEEFAPQLTTHILEKGTPYDLTKPKGRKRRKTSDEQQTLPLVPTMPDVVISTYAKLAGWSETWGSGILKSVTWDEAQELRRGTESAKGAAAQHIAKSVDYRLALTGTPIYNQGTELYHVLECVKPGALGEIGEFHNEWAPGGEKVEDPKALGSFLRREGLMLRRTRADVGIELPKFSRIFHNVDSDEEPLADVEEAAVQLAKIILHDGPEAFRGERLKASQELSYLVRQATGIAKAGHVADLVRMLVESDEPVLLAGWHRRCYEIWNERLAVYKPVMVTGSESEKQKDQALQEFIAGRSRVIMISLRAAAGLDGMQAVCSSVVHGELDWAFGVHEQVDTRIDRPGQTRPVFAYYTESSEGSDPILATMLREKAEQLQGIRDPDVEIFAKLETDDEGKLRNLAESFLNRRARSKEVA